MRIKIGSMRIDIIKANVNHAPAIVYTGRAAFREAFTTFIQ